VLLKISQVHNLEKIDKVIFHSIDISLYQVSIEIDGAEFYLTDNRGKFLRAFNVLDLQKQVRGLPYEKMVIRHVSPYDEMVGLPTNTSPNGNTLEVEVTDNQLS
jgi:hypothetical protein